MPHRTAAPQAQEAPDDFTSLVGDKLAAALRQRGFTALTKVQEAVIEPKLAGRDLRITSQTGSGKTVAIGLALRSIALEESASQKGVARPRMLVVAPTRELAKQVEEELSWLYGALGARVLSVTGGASVRDERRAMSNGPRVIVGTPGRLLDHLKRGGIDATQVAAVVLDEADRMLDLGFREDLEAILAFTPKERLTHLVSATFPREVRALADRVQNDPAFVEGTPLGTANTDIEHVIHVTDPRHRVDAIVNLLLATPEAQTLVFVRTRAEVARITRELSQAGFNVSSLSGEMEQPARDRALKAFRSGELDAMIATDVAARGIDVKEIARVIHAEPPEDADAYTHRSGRTGRAGRKGMSLVLATASGLTRTSMLLKRAGVRYRVEPLPTAKEIRASRDERVFEELTREEPEEEAKIDPRTVALAERLAKTDHATRALTRLLARTKSGGKAEPRDIRPSVVSHAKPEPRVYESRAREARPYTPRVHESRAHEPRKHEPAAHEPRIPEPRKSSPRAAAKPAEAREHEARPKRDRAESDNVDWIPFRVSWGREKGADPRRMLAVVCRRGGIRGSDVGAIEIQRNFSIVNVNGNVAADFATAAGEPDPRDPKVLIRLEGREDGGSTRPRRRRPE